MPYTAERVYLAAQLGIDPRAVDAWSDAERWTVMVALAELRKHKLLAER